QELAGVIRRQLEVFLRSDGLLDQAAEILRPLGIAPRVLPDVSLVRDRLQPRGHAPDPLAVLRGAGGEVTLRAGQAREQAGRRGRQSCVAHAVTMLRRRVRGNRYFGSKMIGRPLRGLPIMTTLAFVLVATFSVASIPFHSRSAGLIPCATMRWKSAIPCASIRLRSASCFSFWRTNVIRSASCSACCFP